MGERNRGNLARRLNPGVIVVKKGEVMSEPTTEAGKAHVARFTPNAAEHELAYSLVVSDTLAIEQEARANADRELREALERVANEADAFLRGETKGMTLTLYIAQARETLQRLDHGTH
jgi:hypothetical protein